MKLILTTFLVLISSLFFGQSRSESIKKELTESLNSFNASDKSTNDFNYIKTHAFTKTIELLDSVLSKELNQIDSTEFFTAGIVFHANDSTFGYYYYYSCHNPEEDIFFSKNCFPQGDGNFSGCLPTLNTDTISNVIITVPYKKKYEVYRSMCPGGARKSEAIEQFRQELLNQYQLVVWSSSVETTSFFIAPPDPKSKIRMRHTTGKF